MNYISEIFGRLNIQSIREFLLHGCDSTEIDSKSYAERLRMTENTMLKFLHGKFPDNEECEKVTDKIYDYAGAMQDVHMEIGLQCGFILAMQVYRNTNSENHST